MRIRLLDFLLLPVFLIGCEETSAINDKVIPSRVPGPGTTYEFTWYDEDSTGRLHGPTNDTLLFKVLDTGLTYRGKSGVVSIKGFMGGTFYISHEKSGGIHITGSGNSCPEWPGWLTMPHIVTTVAEFKRVKTSNDTAWWYAPEIGFVVKFLDFPIVDGRQVKRSIELLRYDLK